MNLSDLLVCLEMKRVSRRGIVAPHASLANLTSAGGHHAPSLFAQQLAAELRLPEGHCGGMGLESGGWLHLQCPAGGGGAHHHQCPVPGHFV